jgi:3-deoxy-manno-octulosonate cytidylyltransferase (CMP-KDO synthetase)
MRPSNTCYAIIPARYASTRFPGKPLAQIHGKPMFWHVYQNARQCEQLADVVLATDDERIAQAAKALNVKTVMTLKDHQSGTDRVFEAACQLKLPKDSVIVNIQGDEPALHPKMIAALVAPFSDPAVKVTTLAHQIDAPGAQNPDQVKVVLAQNKDALYFSRAPIPCPRGGEKGQFYGHIGIYAFRFNTLKRFVSLPCGKIEKIEKLEQLRLLENNIPVCVVITKHKSIGVDRPEDIPKAGRMIKQLSMTLRKGK